MSLHSIELEAIDVGAAPSAAAHVLVESIRKHGVLEPLLVQQNLQGKHRLISGRQRLAAARAAGLKTVPCILHAITDAEAAEISAATRVTASPVPSVVTTPAPNTSATLVERNVDEALRSIASAAALSASPSAVVVSGAAQIVSVEAHRALRLLTAIRVLGGEFPIHRTAVRLGDVVKKLADSVEREQRLGRLAHTMALAGDEQLIVQGSEELLVTAAYAVVTALGAAVGPADPRSLQVSATVDRPTNQAIVDICENGLTVPDHWIATAFEQAWPVTGGPVALILLRAARRIAAWHGGSVSMHLGRHGTDVRLKLPLASLP